MTIDSWLALVLTVNGLVVLTPLDPYVDDQVEPTLGMSGTKAAQLDVAETPTAMLTVSFVFPVPPVQYILKLHTPAATVCAGRLLNDHVVVTPPDWIWHEVVLVPTVWSTVLAVHPGAVPVPCMYSGLPAALTTGARTDAIARPPNT